MTHDVAERNTEKTLRAGLLALLALFLVGCSNAESPNGEIIYTGGPTWTGKWVRCDHWQANSISSCTIYVGDDGPRNISETGDYILRATLWDHSENADARDGDLLYSFLGNTLFVGPKDLYLLPVNVRRFLYGEEVGFTFATEKCRHTVHSGTMEQLWQSFSPARDRIDVERAFEKFARDPSISERAAKFVFQDFREGNYSGGRWVHISYLDQNLKYDGILIGDCWGSFSHKSLS